MSYRIMPPGSYLFWQIGRKGPYYRWAITGGLCLLLVAVWYWGACHLLFSSQHPSSKMAQCATQLAELAQEWAGQELQTAVQEHSSLTLLNLCEQAGVAIQSCTCQKPIRKNNLMVQRVSCVLHGSLAQLHALFGALETSTMPIMGIEATLKQQSNKQYSCSLVYDCIIPCS